MRRTKAEHSECGNFVAGVGYCLEARQTGVTHQIGLSVLDGVGYGMDSMGRRTSITRPGGQNDSYGYDAAGQVTAGNYLATPSGNQSDGFAYDAMGNRTTSARNGVNVSYSANALEQYSGVGGAVPTYDAGGNSLSLPVPGSVTVEMTWDAENRMLSSTRNGAAVGATVLPLASSLVNGARVVNRYDVLHRRVVKEVHAPNGSGGWTLQERRLFTYDGWNVIEERAFDAGGSLVAWERLTWGRDASGRLQGAGGVGGLLLAEELPVNGVGSAVGHYPGYDGNGNVVLMTTGSGVVEGRWRYGAFGGTLGSVTASGGYAERQPWRFSGKYLDGEVETRGGVSYYGYRHYVPEVGRWVSRDPIEEKGGVNLYGMVENRVVNTIDYLGLETICFPKGKTKRFAGGGWEVTQINPVAGTASGFRAFTSEAEVTWEAEVELDCLCQCFDGNGKPKGASYTKTVTGTRTYTATVEVNAVYYDAGAGSPTPIPLPSGATLAEQGASALGEVADEATGGPTGPVSLENADMKDQPRTPDEGSWKGGNPCK